MVTTRSGATGVAVLVGATVGVFVGVLVGVDVGVCVGVSVAVLVGVAVGVAVGVSVGVSVGVLLGVGETSGVLVGAGARMVVLIVTELFVSSDSLTVSSGSTVAVLSTMMSLAVLTIPFTITVVDAPGPKEPSSQSSVPPVMEPVIMQNPLVVDTEAYVKVAAGVSMRRTESAAPSPRFSTSMV